MKTASIYPKKEARKGSDLYVFYSTLFTHFVPFSRRWDAGDCIKKVSRSASKKGTKCVKKVL